MQVIHYLLWPILTVLFVGWLAYMTVGAIKPKKRGLDYDYIRKLELEIYNKVYEQGGGDNDEYR